MTTVQTEARLVVIKSNTRPFNRIMTLGAKCTEPSTMRVILSVAIDTGASNSLPCLVDMAGSALRIGVPTQKLERCFVMVETDLLPVFRRMAIGTACSEAAKMWIILLVAGDTGLWCLSVLFALDMAVGALDRSVLADQRIVRQRVIKMFSIKPDNISHPTFMFGMAALAVIGLNLKAFAVEPEPRVNIGSDLIMAVQA